MALCWYCWAIQCNKKRLSNITVSDGLRVALSKWVRRHSDRVNHHYIEPVLHLCCPLQVLSGDAIVVRGQPKGGPPPERTIGLSNVIAPRLARRANPNIEGAAETKDEVCPIN